MKIRKLTLQNLNSLRIQQTIDFTNSPLADAGLFAITGDTGSGKTTILDALTLALYGKVHRNKDVSEVMTYGETESLAEVEFESKTGIFRASWKVWRANKKADGNLRGPERSLSKWNKKLGEFEIIAEKIREVDKGVEDVSGLDYDRFCRSVLLSQGDFAAFLKADEKERSELLERITGREIYTQLSKAAFDRHKIEKEKVDDLHQQKENLQLLDEEEVKELKAALNTKQKDSARVKEDLNHWRKKEQIHQKYFHLQEKNTEKETALSAVILQKKAAEPDRERLNDFKKIRVFQLPLSSLEQQQKSLAKSQQEIQQLAAKLPTIKAAKETISQEVLQQENTYQSLKKDFVRQKPILEKVKKLDLQLAEKAIPLTNRKATLLEQQKEVNDLKIRVKSNESEQKTLTSELADLKEWMKNNTHFQNLAEDLPKIELLRDDLRVIFKERKQGKEVKEQAEALHQKMITHLQKVEKDSLIQKENYEKLKATFDETSPNKMAKSRTELIQFLYDDIEDLGKVKGDLQELCQINEQYEVLLVELSDWEMQIEGFWHEELDISKQLMSSTETLDAMNENLTFKQQIYEQQQLIANYEKDRNSLKKGDPCPLCFSQQHPFRLKKIIPFIDAAKKELDQAKAGKALVYKNHKLLIGRHNALATAIEQLNGDSHETGGQIARQVKKIEGFEVKMAGFAKTLAADLFAMSRSSLLSRKLNDLKKQIQTKKKALTQMQNLVKSLSEKEKLSEAAANILMTLQIEIKAKKQALVDKKEQFQQLDKRFETVEKTLNKVLKKYDCVFDLKTAAKMFKNLQKKKTIFVDNIDKKRQKEEQLSLLISQIAELKNQLITATGKQIKMEQNLQKEQREYNEIATERKTLFGEKNAQETLLDFETKLEKAAFELQKIKDRLGEVTSELKSKQHLLSDKEKQDKILEKNKQVDEQEIYKNLAKINISSLTDLRAKLLDESEVIRIEKIQNEIFEKATALQQSLADIKAEINLLSIDIQEDVNILYLKEQIENLDEIYAKIEQEVGAFEEKLRENDARKKEATSLLKQIKKQEKEYLRWAKLNELIGQADGKKFRIFAQGLTLRKLVALANIHLQNLNERYFIRKPNDQNLHLEIVDTFQADNRRSMLTLSGGESFLVSLALALGLSDLAGRQTQIKSLFIDEGFGSLDENTLDMALSTLENLRASGKTIGLISHVSTLKERIATQIKVHKSGNGFSRIEVIA